jgi:A/G-specific adenine glycosylase
MLQQTQVKTVIPYYQRFMAQFPDVASLAAAPLDRVLARWSGLGYYARARNLHRAAGLVVSEHGGEMPSEPSELMALPGIGRSTAAAILALAAGRRLAILDGNVKRVLARYHAIEGWPGGTAVTRALWDLAEAHTPHERVAEYTQAIMDLGATLCTRGQPRCAACPVAAACAAHALGRERDFPAKRQRAAERRARSVTVLVVQDGDGATLLERRPPSGIWGGLFSFPELADDERVDDWCLQRLGAEPKATRSLAAVEHAFTHFDLTLKPMQLALEGAARAVMDGERWLWYKASEPLPGGIAAPIGKILREVTQPESAS